MFEGEFLHEEGESENAPFDVSFTVLGWLAVEFGERRAKDIYARLLIAARAVCAHQNIGGKPGIVFNDDGGEFVSLDD